MTYEEHNDVSLSVNYSSICQLLPESIGNNNSWAKVSLQDLLIHSHLTTEKSRSWIWVSKWFKHLITFDVED